MVSRAGLLGWHREPHRPCAVVRRVFPAFASAALCMFPMVLPAQRALIDRLPPDADVGQHRYVGFGDEFESWDLPGKGPVRGLARIGGDCWIARGEHLHRVAWASQQLLRTVPAPKDVIALTADTRFVHALAGRTLHVIDPVAGQSVRTVAIESIGPPTAIAAHRDALFVTVGHTLMRVDIGTGELREELTYEDVPQWLASDGQRLWIGTDAQCRPLLGEGTSKEPWAGCLWPWRATTSAAVWVEGRLLLAAEYRDRLQVAGQCSGWLRPSAQPAVGCVTLKLSSAPKLRFELGPKPLPNEAALAEELRRLAADPAAQVPGADGARVPLPVEIEANVGVKVRDVARIWDLVIAAGFPIVRCPEQEAWVRRNLQEGKSAPAGRK